MLSLFSEILRRSRNIIRNVFREELAQSGYHKSWKGTDTELLVDLWTIDIRPIVGKDFIFHNLGASEITVLVDDRTEKTVRKHDVYNWFDGIDFQRIKITNAGAVEFELVVWGDYR